MGLNKIRKWIGYILFLEEYFESASIKFEIALVNAEEILSNIPKDEKHDEWRGSVLRLVLECYNNIATCYFKCSTNSSMNKAAVLHSWVRKEESYPCRFIAAKILYRRAQAYEFLHRFKSSEADLVMAKSILADLGCITTSVGQENPQIIKLLWKIWS